MNPEREKAIKKHFDKQIKKFKREALKIALENDWPYIEVILSNTLREMKLNAKERTADVRKGESFFLG